MLADDIARIPSYEEVVESVLDCLDEESANRLLSLKLSDRLDEQLQLTAERCTEGELTDSERDSYRAFIELIAWVNLFQLRLREPRRETL